MQRYSFRLAVLAVGMLLVSLMFYLMGSAKNHADLLREGNGQWYLQSAQDVTKSGPSYLQSARDVTKSGPSYLQSARDVTKSGPSYLQSARDVTKSSRETDTNNNSFRNTPAFFSSVASELVTHTPEQQEINDTCSFPAQDPFHPSILQKFVLYPTVTCPLGIPSLFYIDGPLLKRNMTKSAEYNISVDHCRLTSLQRNLSDFIFEEELHPHFFDNSTEIPPDGELFYTTCFFENKTVSRTYLNVIKERIYTEQRSERNYARHIENHSPKETLSVILVGVDGLSRQSFIRSMNGTRDFLLKEMDALELYKFNKVGYNTFPNVVPMLSGLSKMEVIKGWRSLEMDEIDSKFLWTDYQKAGYRTAMILDRTNITAFHYLKNGWIYPPFDYYNRALTLKIEEDRAGTNHSASALCVGQTPEVSFLLDGLVQLASVFNNTKTKPYFAFNFLNRLTHDSPLRASAADQLYLDFLRRLNSARVLNNTLLVFFSDHGPRFGPSRLTFSGILETRTPFAFLVFPDWFKKKYPQVMTTVKVNQNRLTTMYDLHATLKELLTFQGTTGSGNLQSRGISLFREIPKNRMCKHAHIPVEFCMCSVNMINVTTSSDLKIDLATSLLNHIVSKTDVHRDLCHELSLSSIITVASVTDYHQPPGVRIYHVVIKTDPNGAIYEATVKYKEGSKVSEVYGFPTRLNFYKGQAECLQSEILRPFCYCKK